PIADIVPTFVISLQNELAPKLRSRLVSLLEVETFESATSLAVLSGFLAARRQLLAALDREKPIAVINLMPHVWTPLIGPAIRERGIRYATGIHDGVAHPGDPTAHVSRWLRREARFADVVVTLSQSVADRLIMLGATDADRIVPLFHPDLYQK